MATGKTSPVPPSGPNVSVHGYNLSPDGKQICFANGELSIARPDGSDVKHVMTGHPFNFIPQWSPDGQWIALISGTHLGDSDLYVVRRDGSALRKVGSRNQYFASTSRWDIMHFHNADSDTFVWSPDSRWIYYAARFGQAADLMRADLDGKVQRLTHSDESLVFKHSALRPGGPTQTGVRNSHISISSDGKWLAFTSTRTGRRQICVMPSTGGEAYPITDLGLGWGARHAHWRPISENWRSRQKMPGVTTVRTPP
jgi:Tol biopolymer transport system component